MAKILILEDDMMLSKDWRDELKARGHDVSAAMSSHEAIAYTQHHQFDMALVDLRIDFGTESVTDSGRFFLRHVTDAGCIPIEKIVGITGFLPMGDTRSAQTTYEVYGITRVLFKPISTIEVADYLENILSIE